MTEIKRIECGQRMSQAVIANGTVWLAGQVAAPGKSAAEQTQGILAQIDSLLKKAGTDKTRIVSAQVWLADMADFNAMNEVWDAWVPQGHAPTRAAGESKLATPDYKVEIIVTAVL